MDVTEAFKKAVRCILESNLYDMSESMDIIEVLRKAELKMGDKE
jgi:hypothetical protein